MRFGPLFLCSLLAAGCGDGQPEQKQPPAAAPADQRAPEPAAQTAAPAETLPADSPTAQSAAEDEGVDDGLNFEVNTKPWTGDLNGMIERRMIRVLVPYSKTFYFLDNATQRGLSYELMQEFDKTLNTKHKLTKLRVAVVFFPTSRDQLIPQLNAGHGDVIAANMTVTPERSKLVEFTTPLATGVKEIVVTSADAPPIASLDDLSGKEIFVQRTSSYYGSLTALNADLKKRGKAPIALRDAPPTFEAEDVLEMVNAGLVKYSVVDRYLAMFWSQIYKDMKVREDLVVREAGDIAFAVRKNSPQLKAELDAFIEKNKRGTTFGNVVIQKYLQNTRWAKSATSDAERQKFVQLAELFKKYSEQYQIDWLLMAAQGYQESGLDQKVRSHVGAIGVMQIMPATGKDMKVGDIRQIEPNIHAGVKYVRFMIDQYYADEPMDEVNKALFAFASYNAGPNRIRSLRETAAKRGLDPNKWFNNVEVVVSEKVGRETVQYVSNIYKYYVAYSLVSEQREKERQAKTN
ncbi:membrane-bound lytic murein transglycosylase MltF [Povalibacter uvarum]|uniref:Membrane-bound lytic murein transglycosylase MltF n=1 Tax=Povalibacter uvarum TaxID=732238 RepID=A0A841HSG0_9GAMM|nr:transporter substrate-binding domain-containing protein [Povalibacter uvarum]MBB6095239.1 membrane-bound lytic murein transglycosylase MltF [Povalibacter uvarum]